MNEIKDLRDILKQEWNQEYTIYQWINENIDKEETLQMLLSGIGNDVRYFHIFLKYAETSLEKWNFVHPKILETIRYIFVNFWSLAEHNIHISDFLVGRNYTRLLTNKQVLDFIVLNFEHTKIHHELQFRLLSYFVRDYHNNLLLPERQSFFRALFESFKDESPERCEDIFGFSLEKLFYLFGYSLSDGYRVYFDITKTSGKFAIASNREIAYLKWLWEEKITESLQEMELLLFINFINRFYDTYLTNNINFLPVLQKVSLEKSKQFYLSLVYKKVLFSETELDDFIHFVLDIITNKKEQLFIENKVFDIKNLLDFISQNNIELFSGKYFYNIIEIVDSNASQSWSFIDYIDRFGNAFVIKDIHSLKEFFSKVSLKNMDLKKKLYQFFTLQIARNYPIEVFIQMEKEFNLTSNFMNTEPLEEIIFDFERHKIHKKSYRFLNHYLQLVYKKFLNYWRRKDVLKEYFSTKNWKTKYILMYTLKKYNLEDMNNFMNKEYRERCYFSSHFPMNLYHKIRMFLERK